MNLLLKVTGLSCLFVVQTASATDPFRVMTWNLEWFFDENDDDNFSKLAKEQSAPSRGDWDWKRDGVAESLATHRADVVAVQEVENRRVLWYLARSLHKSFDVDYAELSLEGRDFYTEQDVGFLLRRDTVDHRSQSLLNLSRSQRDDKSLMDLSKHMVVQIGAIPGGRSINASESIMIVNLHLRASEKAVELRRRQCRLLHAWVADAIKRGENVIVLGDFNTEVRGEKITPDDDLGIAMGLETRDTADDLVDVTLSIAKSQRQSHVLAERTFDRILVSRPLLEDDPGRLDLVFSVAGVLPSLAVRGAVDTADDHWDNYWDRDPSQRDVSDHYPVMAEFQWR